MTHVEAMTARARAAWTEGLAAMAAARPDLAVLAFERASRLAPEDMTSRLSLATSFLALGRCDEAAALFRVVAEASDAQAAWLGAAAADLRAGRPDAAAMALHPALSRHVAGSAIGDGAFPDAVVRALRGPGWCGMRTDGALVVRANGATVLFDGAPSTATVVPPGVAKARVTVGGLDVLGSPLDIVAMRRLEGAVGAENGAVVGWAWHPGDAARDPELRVATSAAERRLIATDADVAARSPLAQPRGFRIETDFDVGPVDVLSREGQRLAGSPVDPHGPARAAAAAARAVAIRWPAIQAGAVPEGGSDTAWTAVPAAVAGPPRAAPAFPARPLAVVVPVYRGLDETLACLADLAATIPAGTAVIVVDDASPEPLLAAALATRPGIRLLRHSENRGFPAAANTGLREAAAFDPPRDVVLLNSDTRMAPGWLVRLRDVVHGAPDIGTATPLSNDATIASYPDPAGDNPPPGAYLRRLSQLAARLGLLAIETPTGVGFCFYIRHECLVETGLLREDVFAQGYGEENDWCLRARHLGWRHVLAPGAYVAHVGGRSFGGARPALIERNLGVLELLHPGYTALIAAWNARDPLAGARRQLDLLRWADRARRSRRMLPNGAVLLVTHDSGGGVERCVRDRAAALEAAGHWPVILRPVRDRSATGDPDRVYVPGRLGIEDGSRTELFPNLRFDLAGEGDLVLRTLRIVRPVGMEVHHMLGHGRAVIDLARRLALPVEWRLHDYALFCPRITLTDPARYCGEPDASVCLQCVADHGSRIEEDISPSALRARSAAELASAARVVVPSADMAARIRRHFPATAPEVVPHEPDPGVLLGPAGGGPFRVVLAGGIGVEKGYDVLLGVARDAAARDLPLRFVVVGHTIDDDRLLATGRVDITGPYREREAVALIAAQGADVGFVPSICPETWCFSLGEILAAGLAAVAFDIGAQAERIRRTGRGWLLPLGAPAPVINRLFLARLAPAAASDGLRSART